MMRMLHSLFGFAPTLGAARVRRDAGLLLTTVLVIAAAVFLAVALPRLVFGAVDSGAQEAVANAGHDADIEIGAEVGTPRPQSSVVAPETVLTLADDIPELLDSTLARAYPDLYTSVLSPSAKASLDRDGGPRVTIKLGMLTPATTDAIALRDGQLPSPPRVGNHTEIDVVVSAEAAEAASLELGDVLEFPESNVDDVVMVIAGIVTPADADSPQWTDLPTLWTPTKGANGASVEFTVLTDAAGITAAEPIFPNPYIATLRLTPDVNFFTTDVIAPVVDEIKILRVNTSSLTVNSGADITVRSSIDTALADYPSRARAAIAQMLVLIVGVLGVASAVVVLLSRLLVMRRAPERELERARGSSLAGIVIRALLESIPLTAIGAALGIATVVALWGMPRVHPAGIAVVLAVGILAAPVQAAAAIVGADRGARRTAANRADRREVERRNRARRLVLEGFLVVVAAGALFAVRTRGLLQTRTDNVDPLLAAAPLLFALAVTVLLLRVYPLVVRLAMRIGRRSRGPLGTLGAMQAQGALAVLPLAALTLAIALVVSGGLLVETVRSGQIDASWQRTGAEVRVQAPLTAAEVAEVASSEGVTAASGVLTVHETQVSVGAEAAIVTLLAVDSSYGEVLKRLPAVDGIATDHDVSALFAAVDPGDPLPVLIDPRLARKLGTDEISLTVGGETRELVEAQIVGTFESGSGGYDRGPFIYIARAALNTKVKFSVDANTLLVMGPGAEAATAELHGTVFSRSQWLVDRHNEALVSGVNTVMLASTGAVALLALIGLIASVLAGARSRRRSLSLLRTLGMSARLGWWLALSELAPLVLAALVGGIVAGVGIILVLGPSFGLETLAGGVQPPTLTISPWVIGAVAAGAVLLALVAMLTEVVAHRRDRLSDVLRVGDSR